MLQGRQGRQVLGLAVLAVLAVLTLSLSTCRHFAEGCPCERAEASKERQGLKVTRVCRRPEGGKVSGQGGWISVVWHGG